MKLPRAVWHALQLAASEHDRKASGLKFKLDIDTAGPRSREEMEILRHQEQEIREFLKRNKPRR